MRTPTRRLIPGRATALVLALGGFAWGLPGARAEVAPSPAPDSLEALLETVTAPASERSVRLLLKRPEIQEPESALLVVGRLWHAGGPAAAAALRTLAQHATPAVREAALRGVAVVGLRSASGSRDEATLRRALGDKDVGVRRAAYDALARVGTAEDVPHLLLGLWSDTPDVRSLALRALRTLTGERLTAEPTRWSYWWEHSRHDLEAQVAKALDGLDGEVGELEEAEAWNVLERRVWVLPVEVVERAHAWMGDWDPVMRARGYRLSGLLRSLASVEDIVAAERKDPKGPAAEALAIARAALGLTPREG